jgi:hypothetical protein
MNGRVNRSTQRPEDRSYSYKAPELLHFRETERNISSGTVFVYYAPNSAIRLHLQTKTADYYHLPG